LGVLLQEQKKRQKVPTSVSTQRKRKKFKKKIKRKNLLHQVGLDSSLVFAVFQAFFFFGFLAFSHLGFF